MGTPLLRYADSARPLGDRCREIRESRVSKTWESGMNQVRVPWRPLEGPIRRTGAVGAPRT